MPGLNGHLIAKESNVKLIKKIEGRTEKDNSVLAPCLNEYKSRVAASNPVELLHNLTEPLLSAYEETRQSIVKRFMKQWDGDLVKVNSSVANSLRRSAGTNYQALLSFALAKYFNAVKSHWYLAHPVPKEFRKALAITFAAGVEESVGEDDSSSNSAYTIQPDVDILLRNASWPKSNSEAEPLVLLSVKTSLVDRDGMAARWKTYFDLATHPCIHLDKRKRPS